MKKNKSLVIAIISSSTVLLLGLMVLMFIGIGRFIDKTPAIIQQQEIDVASMIALAIDMDGIITGKTSSGFTMFNLSSQQEMEIEMNGATLIYNRYNQPIPFQMIDLGEIVQIVYEPAHKTASRIQIHPNSWARDGVSSESMSLIANSLTLGFQTYTFNTVRYIIDSEYNQLPNILHVQPYDTLDIKGMDDGIYSVHITENAGYIEVTNLPTYSGRLEINRQRQIPLNSIDPDGYIPVTAGLHNIVLYMDGYDPVVIDANISEGQVFEINAANANLTEYIVNVRVNNNNTPYEISINDTLYIPGEPIYLNKGEYNLRVLSTGYEAYERQFSVSSDRLLSVTMTPVNTVVRDAVEAEFNNAAADGFSVSFDTSPSGARLFIDGQYVGVTPMSYTMGLGIFKAEFELEGYERYSTSIVLETQNLQLRYLYILTPLF